MLFLKQNKKYILQIILTIICSFSYGQNIKLDSASYHFKKALNFDNLNKHNLAFKHFIISKELYQIKKIEDSVAECDFRIYNLLISQKNLSIDAQIYFDSFTESIKNSKDTLQQIRLYKEYAIKFNDRNQKSKASVFYQKIIQLSILINNKEIEANTYSNLGLVYTNYKQDSAVYFFKKALELYDKNLTTEIFSTYLNFGNLYQEKKDFFKAIENFKKAEKIEPKKYSLNLKRILFYKMAYSYKEINNFENAYVYIEKYIAIKDSINNIQQNTAISEIKEKYDNDQLKAKNIKNRNFLIASLLFILFAGTIGILSLKNSKRKRKLLEQQKELETQKNLTLLKEQELTTINAMVDGQEKERKRIAEDLHDNLGSVLATLKLHFENLQMNKEKKKINQEELFNKTESLIDEAYLKVRSIAHAKNAGVIANQGLLTAVKMMAEKISSADAIKIEVIDYGLDKRLENSLEITVFRIIQELITNIIKHAEAKNATINISLYDKNLNIIIEDDGLGFDIKKVNLKNGMGISSIKTRVEHLKGTFEVDSTLEKGTSIIIDIPTD